MVSQTVIKLCQEVRQAGGRALLVGGWVRDFVRGFETVDYDIEVYGIEAGKLRGLLDQYGRVDAVGEAFTVYKVRLRDGDKRFVVDVSLPRRESKTSRGHRGFVVEGDPSMSIEEAACRRDFTINAIMYDPLTEEYLDPYGGREDLQRKLIRVVDPNTFVEDSLRVLRAMQFASRFQFEIEAATVQLCRGIDLSDLPAERIWAEVEKWLLQSERPSIGLRAAHELGIIEKLWPEIQALIDTNPESFLRLGRRLDEARKLIDDLPRPKRIAVMLAALCSDFGKQANGFLARLKVFTVDHYDVRSQALSLIRHREIPETWFRRAAQITDGDFRRLALRVEPGLIHRLSLADNLSDGVDASLEIAKWFVSRVRELGVEMEAPKPLLMGRHVLAFGLEPGPRIGEITRAVYEMQLDGEVSTIDDAIEAARRIIEIEEENAKHVK